MLLFINIFYSWIHQYGAAALCGPWPALERPSSYLYPLPSRSNTYDLKVFLDVRGIVFLAGLAILLPLVSALSSSLLVCHIHLNLSALPHLVHYILIPYNSKLYRLCHIDCNTPSGLLKPFSRSLLSKNPRFSPICQHWRYCFV